MINLTPKQLRQAATIQEKILGLQRKLDQLLGSGVESAPGRAPSKARRFSAATKARMRAAQKARWAKVRAAKANPVPKAKRKISKEGLANIRTAQKARWAKAKQAGKLKR